MVKTVLDSAIHRAKFGITETSQLFHEWYHSNIRAVLLME